MAGKKVLGATYKPGKPEKPLKWINFQDRETIKKYIRTSERYWYGEGFGSEKRKTPA